MINATHMCPMVSCTCSREPTPLYYYRQPETYRKSFTQRNSVIIHDAYSLADKIDGLANDITSFSVTSMRNELYEQLQQWRDKSIHLIKKLYKQKRDELNTKICQLDTAVSQIKAQKQEDISLIKMRITDLIGIGQPTLEQLNCLRKLVDQIALDMDKLRSTKIRIENRPVNIDACRIIYTDPVPHIQPAAAITSHSRTRSSDNIKDPDKETNRFRSTTVKSKGATKKNKQTSSTYSGRSLKKPHSTTAPASPPTSQHIIPMPPPLPKTSEIPMPPPIPEAPSTSTSSSIAIPLSGPDSPPMRDVPCITKIAVIPVSPTIPAPSPTLEPPTTTKVSHIPVLPSIPEPPSTPELPSTYKTYRRSVLSRVSERSSISDLPPTCEVSHETATSIIPEKLHKPKPPPVAKKPRLYMSTSFHESRPSLKPTIISIPATVFEPPPILEPPTSKAAHVSALSVVSESPTVSISSCTPIRPSMFKSRTNSAASSISLPNLKKIPKKLRFMID